MVKITCRKCKHNWETKTKLKFVTCPSCQLKVKVPSNSDKKEEKKFPAIQTKKRRKKDDFTHKIKTV